MLVEKDDNRIICQCIDKWNSDSRLDNKKIYIFGCTKYARDIWECLLGIGKDIEGFIDNNPGKEGIKCLGKGVLLPQKVIIPVAKDIVIVVCAKQRRQMVGQLKEFGYDDNSILVIPVKESVMNEGDSKEAFEKSLENVEAGKRVYKGIVEGNDEVGELFLCPYPGTGDVYLACVYLPLYLKKRNINNYTIAVVGNNCKKVLDYFGIHRYVVITKEDSELLLKAWEFYGDQIIRLKPLLYWGWRLKHIMNCRDHKQLSFSELFKYDVFELEEFDRMTIPIRKEISVEQIEMNNSCRLRKGKTVILSPYAGSFISEISIDTWGAFAEELIYRGYDVYTNCYGTEQPVRGTHSIQFSYEDGPGLIEYAGGFVGLRSGLCDILSSVTNATFVVLYEAGFSATNIDFFGLKKMGLSKNAIEIVYNPHILDDLLACFPRIDIG